jgi:hypothetical protein
MWDVSDKPVLAESFRSKCSPFDDKFAFLLFYTYKLLSLGIVRTKVR